MRRDHPIFQGPLDVVLDEVEVETPDHYRSDRFGEEVPARLDGWKVQTGKLGKEIDYGLVSTPYGFEDSPDAEAISSGLNSKGPHSVALGRHGTFFLWGFAGDPTQMTESGRRVFVNVLHYMGGFAGKPAIVERKAMHRDMAPLIARSMRGLEEDDRSLKYYRKLFGVLVRQATGQLDPERLPAYLAEHEEHLWQRAGQRRFQVDPDLAEIGLSNRKPAFFEAIAARLRASPTDETALRLLERYASDLDVPPQADAIHAWLESHRDRLFFSDVGGYRWFLTPEAGGGE